MNVQDFYNQLIKDSVGDSRGKPAQEIIQYLHGNESPNNEIYAMIKKAAEVLIEIDDQYDYYSAEYIHNCITAAVPVREYELLKWLSEYPNAGQLVDDYTEAFGECGSIRRQIRNVYTQTLEDMVLELKHKLEDSK